MTPLKNFRSQNGRMLTAILVATCLVAVNANPPYSSAQDSPSPESTATTEIANNVGEAATSTDDGTGISALVSTDGLTDATLADAEAESKTSMSSGLLSTLGIDMTPQLTDPRAETPYVGPATIDMNPAPRDDVNSWASNYQPGAIRLISAYSPSMERDIPLLWFPAQDQSSPAPVLYVLPGRFGGETGEVPLKTTMVNDIPSKNINVISPIPGAFTNYTDWLNPDEHVGGKNYWETFFTKELPEPLNEAINGNGKQAIFGGSASASSVLNYAIHNPGLYSSVASISGCALTNGPLSRHFQSEVVAGTGADPENMYGPRNSAWARYSDAYINAIGLKDQPNVYVYSGTGLLGDYELGPLGPKDKDQFWEVMTTGGAIEAGVNWCTHMLEARTGWLGIDSITFEYSPVGTHAGNYMQNVMNSYVPVLVKAFSEDEESLPSTSSSSR